MKILTICMQCQVESGQPNLLTLALKRIPDDGMIEMTCEKGHRTFTIIQQMKFEILSDMAIKAIVDGYYRDAIASFIGALERLHEFFIEATCRKSGIEGAVYKAAWKTLTNLSERQLGAFIAAHLIETGQVPKLLPQNQTKLRNDVIHKGKFPDRAETVGFGQAVLDCATPILRLLTSELYSSTVQQLVGESLGDRYRIARNTGFVPATYSMSTLLNLGHVAETVDLESAIAAYLKRPPLESAVGRRGEEA